MNLKFLLILFTVVTYSEQAKKLKQVIILSRHNVRTPLSLILSEMTPKSWPTWREKTGDLTAKGATLEGFMGVYFSAWLKKEGVLPQTCPKKEDIFVYSNVKQRTIASAYAFVSKGFPHCNITIHHRNENIIDPTFNPVIHNSTKTFQRIALREMEKRLQTLQLNNSYADLENILDYHDSKFCKVNQKCNLTTDSNKIIISAGERPNVDGPLKIGNSVLDAFIMEFYEGFPLKNVAWGLLDDSEQWRTLIDLSKGYHNVIFNTTLIAQDISRPLIQYISNIFLEENGPKVTLLMGHDANLYTILNGMRFKPYNLHNQYELCPVGGKLVYQKWYDEDLDKYFLKTDFVYQSTEQLRFGTKLSLDIPPQFAVLELEGCILKDGYCSWSDFVKILEDLLR